MYLVKKKKYVFGLLVDAAIFDADVVSIIVCRWNSYIRYLSYVVLHPKNIGKSQSCHMLPFLSLNNHTSDA
jgi:hypothetical protein